MDFSFTPEQDSLRSLVREFLAKHSCLTRSPGSYDVALWQRFADDLGLASPEIEDVELAIILEETGRALLALPYLSTMVGSRLCGSEAGLVAVALSAPLSVHDGLLFGTAPSVMDADVATAAVVAAGDGLYLVPLDGVTRHAHPTLDQSRPVADLTFDGASATRLEATVDDARDLLYLALAAEALGTAAASLSETATHLRTRHQFGAPLASFQALRHRMADLAVRLEGATSTTWYAVRAPLDERPVHAPMAKLVAADAAYAITAESIQLHGGIGFTWEHPAHRYFKRATVTRLTHGDPATLRELIGARAGLFDSRAGVQDRCHR